MAATQSRSMRALVKSMLHRLPMKPLMFGALKRTVNLPERIYRHLHFRGPMTVAIGGQRSFAMHHWGNQIENDIFWAGLGNNWEATTVRLWLRLATEAKTVLDIGANTGVFALAAQAANPDARVFAFEPVERVHARLVHNIESNGFGIEAVRVGASDESGTASFFDVPAEHVYSASLDREMLADRDDMIEMKIDIVRIDDFLSNKGVEAPMLVKIDTERHELQVLQGFGKLIADARPIFLVEILDRVIGDKVAHLFEGLDYVFHEVLEGEGLQPAKNLGSAERNYLICPRETAERLSLGRNTTHASLAPR